MKQHPIFDGKRRFYSCIPQTFAGFPITDEMRKWLKQSNEVLADMLFDEPIAPVRIKISVGA